MPEECAEQEDHADDEDDRADPVDCSPAGAPRGRCIGLPDEEEQSEHVHRRDNRQLAADERRNDRRDRGTADPPPRAPYQCA